MASDLLTVSEIAVAFVGFASIVVLFRRSGTGRWKREDAYGFRDMVSLTLGVAAWAALPFFVSQFTELREAWRVLCGLFGFTHLFVTARGVVARFRSWGKGPIWRAASVSILSHFAIAGVLILAALGVLGSAAGIYAGAIALLLLNAGLWFLQLVAVREDQLEDAGG